MNNLRNFPPVTLGIFQSTLLQEERLKLKYIQNGNSYFNPRSYKRSDERRGGITFEVINFNPRSYKRSDFMSSAGVSARRFQSTLLQEERLTYMDSLISQVEISIHAPTRGATGHGALSIIVSIFQSTLLQEERRQKCTIILILICNNYCIVSIKSHQHYNNYFM